MKCSVDQQFQTISDNTHTKNNLEHSHTRVSLQYKYSMRVDPLYSSLNLRPASKINSSWTFSYNLNVGVSEVNSSRNRLDLLQKGPGSKRD